MRRFIAGLGILLFITTVKAAPMYYTFQGAVNWGPVDELGIMGSIQSGDPVTYVWKIDFDELGYNRAADGTESAQSQFYAELVSGRLMDPADAGMPYDPNSTPLSFYGVGLTGQNASFIDIRGSHIIQIYNLGDDVTNLEVGDTGFSVYARVTDIDNKASRYQSLGNVTLTNISAVPIPAAAWLFGSGLLGLIGFSKRKKAA